MSLTADELAREAAATGFSAETLEKVFRLLELLDGIRAHPLLQERLALKGGTALNLFMFDVPRLSVDIDLNYLGADRETMLAELPQVQQAVAAVCGRQGIAVKRVPKDHAGGKWRLTYDSPLGGGQGRLELDLNFMLRTPLWQPHRRDSRPVGSRQARGILVLDDHELAAGKLAALMVRSASRDLFDARALLRRCQLGQIDQEKLRVGFVVYGGISRKDWRTIVVDDITAEPLAIERELVPMLRTEIAPARAEIAAWTKTLVSECRDLMSVLLPLTDSEREFLDRLNDLGEIRPDLLTNSGRLRDVIRVHPGLSWKALNVRKHRGLDG